MRWNLPLGLTAALLTLSAPSIGAPAGQETNAPTPAAAVSNQGDLRSLTIDDYARWRSIDSVALAADGSWAAFAYQRHQADAELHLRRLGDDRVVTIERGSAAAISDDGRFAAYRLSLPWQEVEALEKKGEPVTAQAQLVDLESSATWTWDDVDRFELSPGGRALAVKRRKADKDAEHDGTDLILRSLGNGGEELLGSVDEYAFNKTGTHLAYTVDALDDNGNGLYLIDLASGAHRVLDNARAEYARLTWSDGGTALAVLRGSKPEGYEERANVLVAWTGVAADGGAKVVYDPTATAGFPADFVLSERGALSWNQEASQVFLGLKEQLPDPDKTEEPIADVNIFHWQDDRLQTVQKARAERDRDFTYLAALDLAAGTLTRLGTERIRRVEVGRDGRWAIGFDDADYISDWQPGYADIYRIDTTTGASTEILERQDRTYGMSPDGGHFLYWRDGQVWDWPLDGDAPVNLTASAPVSFADMEWDYYGERPAYGVAGWSVDGAAVVLEHRYDLWLQPLDGSPARSLTGGAGARDEVRYRYLQLDPDEVAIDLTRPLLLSAYGEWTKKAGYVELPVGGGEPTPLIWEDKRFGRMVKARASDRLLFTIEDFRQFPDYWTADITMATPARVTDANPWQAEYLWGDRILFEYVNDDGVRLQGTLAIPDTYEPGQRLPMIVRFYEKYSQDLHLYPTVRYRHEPNFADYVSNGYLVMQPDVHFRVGSSHSDMLECVEAATRKVIEMGYADAAAIGLSGHSYSGGGSSYIAARSHMFAAVASGAAPINLTSEFNQLFLGSGGNNHSYDIYGQGRYGTNPYDDPEVYEYESPITWARDMDTPMLYLHGEDDPTVGYVQGMEWFNALRFNNKPVIFLSYPGEGHGLRKFENQIDFQKRLHQFFDHHLRGFPAPAWMTRGRTYLEKERELKRRQD